MKKILLLTSGGDAPGMNAAIRSVVRSAGHFNLEIYACHNGYQGLIDHDIFRLNNADVTGIINRGGTILKSSRSKDFYNIEKRKHVAEFLKTEGISALIIIGGDGSFQGATLLSKESGVQIIGIPGTIDNDIIGTEYTIGFDTARNTALRAIDNIRDTASSNNIYFLIEVMGQRSGFLAADVALAGGADYVLTPEFPLSIESLVSEIIAPRRKKNSLIIVVAEAGNPGRSIELANKLRENTPFKYRTCILGHIQRGGAPSVQDRLLASEMGYCAIKAIFENRTGYMTAVINHRIELVEFPANNQYRKLNENYIMNLTKILSS